MHSAFKSGKISAITNIDYIPQCLKTFFGIFHSLALHSHSN